MGALRLFQKLLNWIQTIIDGFAYRKEKRFGAEHGTDASVKRARRLVSISMIGAVVLLLLAIGIRESLFFGSSFFMNRELPSAPHAQLQINDNLNKTDLDIIKDAADRPNGTNCALLTRTLTEKGFLSPTDKALFLADCAPSLDPAISGAIAQILSLDLAPDTAKILLKNLDSKSVAQITQSLNNPDVATALRSESGASIANAMSALGSLSPEEAATAVAIIAATPPQYREASISAIKDIGAMSDPAARKTLLTSLQAAKSPEEVMLIKNFAREAQALTPEEQRITSAAFVQLATPEAKRAMTQAVKALATIAKDDPVRGRLLDSLAKLPSLPPEQQAGAANAIASIATRYAAETDPAKKMAIADAIGALKLPEDAAVLEQKLVTLDGLKDYKIKNVDLANYLLGKDPNIVSQIDAAAQAAKVGNKQDAEALLSGGLLAEKSAYKDQSISNKAVAQKESSSDVKQDVKAAEAALNATRSEIRGAEAEIYSLKALNLAPVDPALVKAYSKLGALKANEIGQVASLVKVKAALIAKINAYKQTAESEFASMGVTMPSVIIPVDLEQISANQPAERLTDLRDVPGFFDSQSKSKKRHKLLIGEMTSSGLVSPSSILATSIASQPKTWVVSGGAGAAGQSDSKGGFEMSRTQFARGIMMKIPPSGIPSDLASKYTLFFQFVGSVADRKTGNLTIPSGSIALCKVQDFDKNTGKLSAKCDKIDVGGPSDIDADITLGDADGSDGLTGAITDNRGWYLAGVFLTAFSAAVLDGYAATLTAPFESKAQKTLGDYSASGSISGSSLIAKDIATKQIDEWQKSPYYWHSFNGALATVHQN